MKSLRLAAAVLALLLAGCGEDGAKAPRSGETLRPFAAQSLAGPAVSLPEAAVGKVVVLSFWATWCAPCKSEMVALEPLWRTEQARGLMVLAVNAGQQPGEVEKFAAELGISYPLLLDAESTVTRAYGVTGLPMTFIVGRDGTVRHRILGEAEPGGIRKMVEDLL